MQPRFDASLMGTLLDALGAHLAATGGHAALVVVGGAALAMRGWVPRTTQDVDVIAVADDVGELAPPEFTRDLSDCVARVARDFNLPDDWLNAVVGRQWRMGLPPGVAAELEWRTFHTLRVGLAGRSTLIALKLFAAIDRGPSSVHLQDLLALAPDDSELAQARAWVDTQDIGAQVIGASGPEMVKEVVDHVRARRRSR